MSDIFKKRFLILSVVVIICGVSVVNYKLQNDNTLETSSDFVAFEEKQLEEMKENLIVGGQENLESMEEIESVATTAQSSSTDYFEEAKAVINMDRNKIISMLTEIIEDREIDSDSKNKAVEQKLQIIDYMNQEKIITNLLNNKGYDDVLVLITDNSVNVTLGIEVLNKSDIAKVLDIVMRETGRPVEQIVIQNKH